MNVRCCGDRNPLDALQGQHEAQEARLDAEALQGWEDVARSRSAHRAIYKRRATNGLEGWPLRGHVMATARAFLDRGDPEGARRVLEDAAAFDARRPVP